MNITQDFKWSDLTGPKLAFDIETNGLLKASGNIKAMDTTHCIAITDMDTDEEFYYGPAVDPSHPQWTPLLGSPSGTVEDGVKHLSTATLAIAHNGVDFDYRALEKFYPGTFKRPPLAWDTFVAAKLIWPYDVLAGPDFQRAKAGQMPMSMVKRHSLKAWGYRLNENKDDYDGDRTKFPPGVSAEIDKERFDRRWEEWNPWMAKYMLQDNRPMIKLWKLIERRAGWVDPKPDSFVWPVWVFQYEHEAADIIARQEGYGVRFDVDKAQELTRILKNSKAQIHKELEDTFGSWWQPGKETTPKIERNVKRNDLPDITSRRVSEKTGKELAPYVGPPLERYSPDAPYTPIERYTFSASSRDHLGMRLQDVFGWKPKKFGASGKPTVDESVLEEIPEAVLPEKIRKLILQFFVVNKTLGMLSQGAKAWLNLVTDDGRIHGRVDPCGAITGRGTHSNPNLGQCPAVIKAKVVLPDGTKTEVVLKGIDGRYGWECRELFIADDGWEQTGVDASALELIDLGHYLVPYDQGLFRDRVCDPARDPHTEHAEITGLTRGDTKTATYLYIYGGSAYKLSLDIDVEPHEIEGLLKYRGLPALLRALERRFDADFVAKLDDKQKAKIVKARKIILAFEEGITGIKDLKASISQAAVKGWLKGMDGRKLHVRKAHAALNLVLQSAGAQTCKLWMVIMHRMLREEYNLKDGIDYKQILWVHDECQFTHKPGMGPIIVKVADAAIQEAGRMLSLRGVYRTDGKVGLNWAMCH